jgi:hypothetical protein
VVEEADGEVWTQFAQNLRHQLQLVVLHPDDSAGGGSGCRGRCKSLVHLDVALPPFAVVAGWRDDVVVERPEGVIGETLVVVGDLGGAQRDRNDPDAVVVEGLELEVGLATPADPRAGILLHHRLEGGDEPAR